MNAMSLLNQIMQQASGGQSANPGGNPGGSDLMNQLGSQFKGRPGSGGGGIDMKSLLGGGALGLLLGSKRGRKMGGKALKYGAVAGVGALAWKAYQNHQANARQGAQMQGAVAQQGQPLEQLQGQAQERRGLEILQAMIMAARADGHVDVSERAWLDQLATALEFEPAMARELDRQLDGTG